MYEPILFFSSEFSILNTELVLKVGESAQKSEPTISINHKSNNFTIGWNLRSPNVVISGSTSDWKNRNLMLSAWVCQDAQTRSEVLLSNTQDLRSEQQEWLFNTFYILHSVHFTVPVSFQGLLETFGQFASPQKATSFPERPGWNVAPWSLQRHLKWRNSSRYTKNGQRLRKFLAPKITWIQVGEIW